VTAEQQATAANPPPIPDALPILPLRGGTVIFPMSVVPMLVGQERSVRLVDDSMRRDRLLALVAPHPDAPDPAGPSNLHRVGTAAMVHQLVRIGDGTLRLVVQGLQRIRIVDFVSTEPYLVARVEPAPEKDAPTNETAGLRRAVLDLFRTLVGLADDLPGELTTAAEALEEPLQVVYLIAATAPLSTEDRQAILELLQHEIAVRELGQKIRTETTERMSKAQREYFLREQLRAIQGELGEEGDPEVTDLRRRLAEAELPEEARREADRELERLASIPAASPEHGIIRTYLEWLVSLPWRRPEPREIDVPAARAVLDEDHYDLDKIKDRILEYLAVRKLRQERARRAAAEAQAALGVDAGEVREAADAVPVPPPPNARRETDTDRAARDPILCFVGPPGVGKTSLGQSIARALGRAFVRVSLGGVHDEAEIRGHRRTYIGALPGRIIQGIRRAATRDPVFMLDEVDKVGADWRGDPSAALLEVLDPAQNHSFVDNYLGVPFDLSQVLFIGTANNLDTIPEPLRDRLEILQIAGYTDEEKVGIAETYLIPKQLAAHGLSADDLEITREAIRAVVRGYTREAGVRNLDREIATICRKVARRIAEGRLERVVVTPDSLPELLGRRRHYDEVAERTERPGVATGLAWTPAGGDVLFVEATMMPSRDERLIITGMLGEVMRESATAALSYVRSNAVALGIDPEVFTGKAVHLHVPEGAIPKDGPSAGVTMVTALTSLALQRPVRSDVAMTGEITLRGKVLPVGGIREKVLAAHRIGIRTVVLPRRNEADLDDVPAELRSEIEFRLVDDAEAVLEIALGLAVEAGVR
jgi:ATP-dependent Lon protease